MMMVTKNDTPCPAPPRVGDSVNDDAEMRREAGLTIAQTSPVSGEKKGNRRGSQCCRSRAGPDFVFGSDATEMRQDYTVPVESHWPARQTCCSSSGAYSVINSPREHQLLMPSANTIVSMDIVCRKAIT